MGKPERIKISDGIDLCFIKADRFKTGKISVVIALPLDGDIAAQAVLPFILRRSCRKYPDFTALSRRLDYLYGAVTETSVEKLGEAHIIRMAIVSIDDRFSLDGESVSKDAAELLFDMIFDPKLENGMFCKEDVEIEKRLLLERKITENDDKRAYALKRCCEIMCENESFGKSRFGADDEIKSLTPERVYAAWQRVLKSSIIRVTAVGSGNKDDICSVLNERFDGIKRCPEKPVTAFLPSAGDLKYMTETQEVKQGKLVLGFRAGMTDRDDYYPGMTVMADIFGGGTYSKLFSVVREKMSLCYYCSARLDRYKGLMFVQSGIETANEEKAKAAILDQLEEMKKGNFSDDDFRSSILAANESLRSFNDSPDVLCSWYSNQLLLDTFETPEERMAKTATITRDDVVRAANNITLDTIFMLAGTGDETDDD